MSFLRTFVVVVACILFVATSSVAVVPPAISYQGKLMETSGAPKSDGTYPIQFAIYGSETGGTPLWSETNTAVQVRGGLFAVLLGSTNNLPANIFDNPSRWFGVKVGTEPEMTPRQPMTSVPSALVAGTVSDGSITVSKLAPGVATPSGTISMFAGPTPPAGWLLCNGSTVSRTQYAELFAAIGTAYGAGDGSTTFNLPNLQDKLPLGKSVSKVLGQSGGAASTSLLHTHATLDHVLSWNEMPAHSHGVNDPGHNHNLRIDNNGVTGGGSWIIGGGNWNVEGWHIQTSFTGISIQNAGGNAGHSHGSTGNGLSTPQDIMNPYVVVNYIIKT